MKKLTIASVLSAVLLSPTAFAQSNGFTGLYGQVGIGIGSANIKDKYCEGCGNYNWGKQAVAGNLALGYNYTFSNRFNLGANAFYNIRSDNAGGLAGSYDLKLKNIWGISIEPGYSFSDDSLGYLKLGWAQASMSYDTAGINVIPSANFGSTNGFLYGVGYKHALNKNLYIGFEAYQILFASKSVTGDGVLRAAKQTLTPNYTYGGIVLGARF